MRRLKVSVKSQRLFPRWNATIYARMEPIFFPRPANNVTTVTTNDHSVLSELLDEELGSDPTTVRHLTNHLPMALVAKANLGADDDELRRFASIYARRNAPLAAVQHELSRSSWTSAIGHRGSSGDLREYFVRCVNDAGVDETLRAHLPALLPGISGAAFHGAIRLAYALEVRSSTRVAAGLSYLAEVAAPLGPITPSSTKSDDPVDLILNFSSSRRWTSAARDQNIGERMHSVAQDEGFQSLASSLQLDEHTEQKLATAALLIYAATDDFTALHGVTGIAAISSLRNWVDDPAQIDLFSFQALAAAYLTIDAPPLWSRGRLDNFVASNAAPVADVKLVGATNNDEHVSKLIYTSHRNWEATGDPLYLAVAARKAGLLDALD